MFEIITQLCGGIGLFLIGMSLMTDSLKEMAGETLRIWLSKFTGSSLKAVFSGIGLTLIVQSSTATTLATIGFVSAGVLTFIQAMGVVIGANIGTTSTGWMVAFLGVKFSIAQFALPLLAIGALLKLFSKGKLALVGLSIAGFSLIFFGIDVLQIAMSDFADKVDLTKFASDTLSMQLILVLIGIVMTILLQSSSAAITATLAALASGAIDVSQALGLVIGQNIGTVTTALLAAIGSTVNAKRTAAVHLIFNIISAVVAFLILKPVFVWLYHQNGIISGWDDVIIVAAFHTAFSVVGAIFFIPFFKQVEDIIKWLLPDHSMSILSKLNEANLAVPALAIQSASEVVHQTIFEILQLLKSCVDGANCPTKIELTRLDDVIATTQMYLDQIVINENIQDQQRLLVVLRLMVYLKVLRSDLEQIQHLAEIRKIPALYQVALDYRQILENNMMQMAQLYSSENIQNFGLELDQLKKWLKASRVELRGLIVQYSTQQQMSVAKSSELFAAQRWLDRLIAHTLRLSNVLADHAKN